jgi:hypothetical protein
MSLLLSLVDQEICEGAQRDKLALSRLACGDRRQIGCAASAVVKELLRLYPSPVALAKRYAVSRFTLTEESDSSCWIASSPTASSVRTWCSVLPTRPPGASSSPLSAARSRELRRRRHPCWRSQAAQAVAALPGCSR